MGVSILFEPLGIFLAVVLATLVGFLVEVNANKKFRLLNQTDDHVKVKVLRNGHVTQVPRCDIVVDDMVLLEAGERVPADGIVVDSYNLTVDDIIRKLEKLYQLLGKKIHTHTLFNKSNLLYLLGINNC